jgi:hypothetical protein
LIGYTDAIVKLELPLLPKMNEEKLRAELHAVYHSWSWRLTAPLRFLSLNLRRVKFVLTSPKRACVRFLQILARRPYLVQLGKRCLNRFPQLKTRVRSAVGALNQAQTHSQSFSNEPARSGTVGLTPKAQQLYALFQENIITKK